jgi:hypothetical protein
LPDGEREILQGLEARLTQATAAAERLMAEAASAAARAGARAGNPGQPPPMGWQAPPAEPGGDQRREDLAVLLDLAGRLRDLVPPELQRRLAEALRELLLAARAVIDWYLERLEHRRRDPVEVTDIPID